MAQFNDIVSKKTERLKPALGIVVRGMKEYMTKDSTVYASSVEKNFRERYLRWDERTSAIIKIQSKSLDSIRDFYRKEGFIEILAPVIDFVINPGERVASQVGFEYCGVNYHIIGSMILYKQLAITGIDRMYTLSPCVRLEPEKTIKANKHLLEFYQADCEAVDVPMEKMMDIGERLLVTVCKDVKKKCSAELKEIGSNFKVPRKPFKVVPYSEIKEEARLLGYDVEGEVSPNAEVEISKKHDDPFWITAYPIRARDYFYREDPEHPGMSRSFDLIFPKGFGEGISGAERETDYDRIEKNIRAHDEKPEKYGWYMEMIKNGVPMSSGFGIGVERLTRFITNAPEIWECAAFPKLPGIKI